MPDDPGKQPHRRLTPERASRWLLGLVLIAALVFAVIVAVLN
jgi:hypothetical protein